MLEQLIGYILILILILAWFFVFPEDGKKLKRRIPEIKVRKKKKFILELWD